MSDFVEVPKSDLRKLRTILAEECEVVHADDEDRRKEGAELLRTLDEILEGNATKVAS